MSLDYDKIKHSKGGHANEWTAYSDLFLTLSVVFLFLYIVANLRSGSLSASAVSKTVALQQEVDDLKRQLKVYEVLKDDYSHQNAAPEEIALYKELTSKLSLLEDDAKKQREAAFQQTKEAQEKEAQLNRYQKLVKTMINANMIASNKIRNREEIIQEKDQKISNLNMDIAQKEEAIRSNEILIEQNKNQLEKKIKELKWAYQAKKKSKEKLKAEIARLQLESDQQINSLKAETQTIGAELEHARAQVSQKTKETQNLSRTLAEKEQENREMVADLERAHQAALAKAQYDYEQVKKQKMLSDQARQELANEFNSKIAGLNKSFGDRLEGIKGQLASAKEGIQQMETSNANLKRNLAASNEKLNAQRMLAKRIQENFKKSGIDADIDLESGDVTINFGEEYFDTGSAALKSRMRTILNKLVPVYAQSLLQDEKVAKKIANVEIIGFASPTYKGKYVDPSSLMNMDREAVSYNMDLSYQRAKSIFDYVFDTRQITFNHQKSLLPLVKVTGRSYLANDKLTGRNLSNVKDDVYCQQHDCKKAQKVIVKFNLSEHVGDK